MTFDDIKDTLGRRGSLIQAAEAESFVTEGPGLYSIFINDPWALSRPFRNYMIDRGHHMLYLGKASRGLRDRLVLQDLGHRGEASFFRSLGAILGYRPVEGSLAEAKNQANYRFAERDRERIAVWINRHLSVRCLELKPAEISLEASLIDYFRPVLNIEHNPDVLPELLAIRDECRTIAGLQIR